MNDCRIALREWESLGPDDNALLQGFRFEDPQHRRLAAQLTKAGKVELRELYDGLHIRARSHVGRIELGRLTLTITPKIGIHQLLTLFRYAYGLRDLKRHGGASYSLDGDLFRDLVIAQLHQEVRQLIERGITRSYVGFDEDLASPRGRLDFVGLAARGGAAAATLPCRHYPRSSDNLLNQIVLAGLGTAYRITTDRVLAADIGRQMSLMAEHTRSVRLSASLLDKASRALNRLVAPYEYILRLIQILHFGTFVDFHDADESYPLPGFLFDMNRFFQSLLNRFLSENLPGFHVQNEYGLTEMMRYVAGQNPRGRQSPKPRPDYAIHRKNKLVALLDAKYRDLWDRSLPREMLYQLSVYALSQPRGSTAAILYPTTARGAKESMIEIREPLTGRGAGFVALRPVNVDHLVSLIEAEGRSGQEDRERSARRLAGVGA